MINTLSLSSDLNTLFLVDADRVIAFDLNLPEGILIGKIQGQIFAVTSPSKDLVSTKADKTNSVSVPIKDNNQFTLLYNRNTAALGLIGSMDIIQTITAPGEDPTPPTGDCNLNLFSLDEYDIHIIRKEDEIIITRLNKDGQTV